MSDLNHFFYLISNQKIADIKKMIEDGFNVNSIDIQSSFNTYTGRTPLMASCMYAFYNGNTIRNKKQKEALEIVEVLLKAGADPNIQNKDGEPALYQVSQDFECCKLLVEYGADIKIGTTLSTFTDDEIAKLQAVYDKHQLLRKLKHTFNDPRRTEKKKGKF